MPFNLLYIFKETCKMNKEITKPYSVSTSQLGYSICQGQEQKGGREMRSKGRKFLLVTEYRDRVTAQILVHKMACL